MQLPSRNKTVLLTHISTVKMLEVEKDLESLPEKLPQPSVLYLNKSSVHWGWGCGSGGRALT